MPPASLTTARLTCVAFIGRAAPDVGMGNADSSGCIRTRFLDTGGTGDLGANPRRNKRESGYTKGRNQASSSTSVAFFPAESLDSYQLVASFSPQVDRLVLR